VVCGVAVVVVAVSLSVVMRLYEHGKGHTLVKPSQNHSELQGKCDKRKPHVVKRSRVHLGKWLG
jgi:hypothetical protein